MRGLGRSWGRLAATLDQHDGPDPLMFPRVFSKLHFGLKLPQNHSKCFFGASLGLKDGLHPFFDDSDDMFT